MASTSLLLEVTVRERENGPNFVNSFSCCYWSGRREWADFAEWIFIHRYRIKGSRSLFPEWTLHLSPQDKERKETHGDLCVYLCIQYSGLSARLLLNQSHRHGQCIGCCRLKSLGLMQRLEFSVKGRKVTALFRVIIVMTSAEDLKRRKDGVSS